MNLRLSVNGISAGFSRFRHFRAFGIAVIRLGQSGLDFQEIFHILLTQHKNALQFQGFQEVASPDGCGPRTADHKTGQAAPAVKILSPTGAQTIRAYFVVRHTGAITT
jgi:hypothetical protein